jgi:hypothetical protein
MNRIDRLYALVEELRAAGPRGRTARQLAEHFELSVRTIERDLSALGQAGVPLATKQGRTGGYTLDRSMRAAKEPSPPEQSGGDGGAEAVDLARQGLPASGGLHGPRGRSVSCRDPGRSPR